MDERNAQAGGAPRTSAAAPGRSGSGQLPAPAPPLGARRTDPWHGRSVAGGTGSVAADLLHHTELPAGRAYRRRQRAGGSAAHRPGPAFRHTAAAAAVRPALYLGAFPPGGGQPGATSARYRTAMADR